jgi:hypothetical protein
MKKLIAVTLAVVMAVSLLGAAPVEATAKDRGGLMGFIAGCCFGIRAGADYNDGKEIHWREWIALVPVVGLVVAIWNGIDGANGMQRGDYAKKYGSQYY